MKARLSLTVGVAMFSVLTATAQQPQPESKHGREINVKAIDVPDGYHIEAFATNLTVPTTAIFDGDDLIVAESGFNRAGKPRVLRIRKDGTTETLASPGLVPPVTGLAMRNGVLYVSHAGKVSVAQGGSLRDIVTGLPHGDHSNNKIVFGPDGKIYMGQGTQTNSAVVGIDSYLFGWLKDDPQGHEVPCKDIVLAGENFESANPLTEADDKVTTGAYKPLGTTSTAGETIKAAVKCGGSIARFNPDGSGFELVAWGLRNPFGVQFDATGQLWTTNHGADVRGSRNIFNDPDYLVRVQQDGWYGWPDFFDGKPVTDARFNAPEKPKPPTLWREHPKLALPYLTFPSHTGTNGLAFSPGGAFGHQGDAFIAAYGTFTPVTTGINVKPVGFAVLRVEIATKHVEEFVDNDLPGPAYLNQQNGLNRPSDVVFGPDSSMYIVDWGASSLSEKGLMLEANTGVVWRVYHDGQSPLRASGPIAVPSAALDEEQQKPMVPNVPETYSMARNTLLMLIGALIVVIALVVWAWRRART
jgi:glucose/arabinose dehydrogenase